MGDIVAHLVAHLLRRRSGIVTEIEVGIVVLDLGGLDLVVLIDVLKARVDVRVDVLVVLDLIGVIVGYRHGHWHGHVHGGVEWHAAVVGWRPRHMLDLLGLIEPIHCESTAKFDLDIDSVVEVLERVIPSLSDLLFEMPRAIN